MVCKQCGNPLEPNAKFCITCGAPTEAAGAPVGSADQNNANPYAQPQNVQPAQPVYAQPAQPQYAQPVQPVQPVYAPPVQPQQPQYAQPGYQAAPVVDQREREMSQSILTMGILAIAFGDTGILGILGIIFGAITSKKVKEYLAAGYRLTGRAKVGSILGRVGMIIGIVSTAILTVYLIFYIALGAYVVTNWSSL